MDTDTAVHCTANVIARNTEKESDIYAKLTRTEIQSLCWLIGYVYRQTITNPDDVAGTKPQKKPARRS